MKDRSKFWAIVAAAFVASLLLLATFAAHACQPHESATMGDNEATLKGVPLRYGFARGSRITEPRSKAGGEWLLPWFVVFESADNQDWYTQVEIQGMSASVLRNGEWVSTHSHERFWAAQYGQGGNYFHDSSSPIAHFSDPLMIWPTWGKNHHGSFGGRKRVGLVDGVRVTMRARSKGAGRYLVQAGADWYPCDCNSDEPLPGVGNSRAVLLGPDWRTITFTTE